MYPLIHWKLWTICGSALLGCTFGLLSTISLNRADIPLLNVMVPVVCGAALGASGGSAIWRMFEAVLIMREIGNRPSDHTLCYRGVRYLLTSDCEAANDTCEQNDPIPSTKNPGANASRLTESSILFRNSGPSKRVSR